MRPPKGHVENLRVKEKKTIFFFRFSVKINKFLNW